LAVLAEERVREDERDRLFRTAAAVARRLPGAIEAWGDGPGRPCRPAASIRPLVVSPAARSWRTWHGLSHGREPMRGMGQESSAKLPVEIVNLGEVRL